MIYNVPYLEKSNDFTDVAQSINGHQISVVTVGHSEIPNIKPEFLGHLYAGQDASGTITKVYIAMGFNITDWKEITFPVDAIGNDIVLESAENDFKMSKQTINGDQIVTIFSGQGYPVALPEFEGQFYLDITNLNNPIIYVGVLKNGVIAWSKLSSDIDTTNFARVNDANNFSNSTQLINSRPIVSYISGSHPPNIIPDYVGQIYVQPANTTTDKKGRLWISNGKTQGTDWEPIGEPFELPKTVVQTSKQNDFAVVEQTLNGHQILSFIDGGALTPEQSKAKPDYEGQLYIARKKVSGVWDAAIWIAHLEGTQVNWIPILKDYTPDLSHVAKLDASNAFEHTEHTLGDVRDERFIVGARALDRNPNFTAIYPKMIGELAVWRREDPKNPSKILTNVYIGTLVNQPNAWVDITSAFSLPDNVARLDISNTFSAPQYLGDTDRFIVGAKISQVYPPGQLAPVSPGEIALYKKTVSGKTYYEVYMAEEESDAHSWVKIFDGSLNVDNTARTNTRNTFTEVHQYIGPSPQTGHEDTRDLIMGARKLDYSPVGVLVPNRIGQIIIEEKTSEYQNMKKYIVWSSVHTLSAKGWIKLAEDNVELL